LPEDQRAAWAEAEWQEIKKKQGRKAGQETDDTKQVVDSEGDKIHGETRDISLAQRMQENRERKQKLAAKHVTTVNAVAAHTSLRMADPEKAEEVKAGKTTSGEAVQAVAEKTGKPVAKKSKLVAKDLGDGLTLDQVFPMMAQRGYQKLEGRVKGR